MKFLPTNPPLTEKDFRAFIDTDAYIEFNEWENGASIEEINGKVMEKTGLSVERYIYATYKNMFWIYAMIMAETEKVAIEDVLSEAPEGLQPTEFEWSYFNEHIDEISEKFVEMIEA